MSLAWFHDFLRMVSVVDRKRFWNFINIKISYFINHFTYKRQKKYPSFITIEPTNFCNLSCPECFTTTAAFTRPKGYLTQETFNKIITETKTYAFYLNLYFQGEPFLNEHLTDFIRQAKENRFYTVVSTNGHFSDKEMAEKIILSGLDRIIISLDGCDAETYKKYRVGGDFEKVLNNIKTLTQTKRKMQTEHPYVELQFLCTKENQHQTESFKKLGKNLGVNKTTLKTLQLIHFEKARILLPEKHSRYSVGKNGEVILKSKFPNRCFRLWSSCVFTWEGSVVPCCFDKNAQYEMGNIHQEKFENIWFGEKYENFRRKVFKERKNIDICTNCSEGLYN